VPLGLAKRRRGGSSDRPDFGVPRPRRGENLCRTKTNEAAPDHLPSPSSPLFTSVISSQHYHFQHSYRLCQAFGPRPQQCHPQDGFARRRCRYQLTPTAERTGPTDPREDLPDVSSATESSEGLDPMTRIVVFVPVLIGGTCMQLRHCTFLLPHPCGCVSTDSMKTADTSEIGGMRRREGCPHAGA